MNRHMTKEELHDITTKKFDYELSKMYYEAGKGSYRSGNCFNNLVSFMQLSAERGNAKYCYGFVLSGIPNIEAAAVAHGWIELGDKIVDVTMLASGYTQVDVSCFMYYPWRKYDAFAYLDALDKYVLPDELMKSDRKFIRKIEEMGYKYIG